MVTSVLRNETELATDGQSPLYIAFSHGFPLGPHPALI